MIKFQKIFLFYQNQDFIPIKITKIGFQNHQFTFVLTKIYPKYLKKWPIYHRKWRNFKKYFYSIKVNILFLSKSPKLEFKITNLNPFNQNSFKITQINRQLITKKDEISKKYFEFVFKITKINKTPKKMVNSWPKIIQKPPKMTKWKHTHCYHCLMNQLLE